MFGIEHTSYPVNASLQHPCDVAVVMTTIVRPSIVRAVRSVYNQQFDGRIQLLIGIDCWRGERSLLKQLLDECPPHIVVTVMDLGYSTSRRNGGLYPSDYGGALKTILSYAANSRYVTYLDDDNWYAADHLSSLLAAISGKDWAFSLRYFVDRDNGELLCPDTWQSMGPSLGIYAAEQGGFVDTNCYMIDKMACYDVFTEWAMTRSGSTGGTGGDRQILQRLRSRPWGASRAHSVYYAISLIDWKSWHPYNLWRVRCAGVDLARFLPQEFIPGENVWQECEALHKNVPK